MLTSVQLVRIKAAALEDRLVEVLNAGTFSLNASAGHRNDLFASMVLDARPLSRTGRMIGAIEGYLETTPGRGGTSAGSESRPPVSWFTCAWVCRRVVTPDFGLHAALIRLLADRWRA
jgi:hypothetical protein